MSFERRVINMVIKPKNITAPEAIIILLALLITAAAFSFIVLNMGFLSD